MEGCSQLHGNVESEQIEFFFQFLKGYLAVKRKRVAHTALLPRRKEQIDFLSQSRHKTNPLLDIKD